MLNNKIYTTTSQRCLLILVVVLILLLSVSHKAPIDPRQKSDVCLFSPARDKNYITPRAEEIRGKSQVVKHLMPEKRLPIKNIPVHTNQYSNIWAWVMAGTVTKHMGTKYF